MKILPEETAMAAMPKVVIAQLPPLALLVFPRCFTAVQPIWLGETLAISTMLKEAVQQIIKGII